MPNRYIANMGTVIPAVEEPQARRFSLRTSLQGLVVACVLPSVLVLGSLGYANYRALHDQIYRETLLLARKVIADVDREFAVVESGLRVLATAPSLDSDDLPAFHHRAREAIKYQIVYNYLLTDKEGKQLLNTALPWGAPLPDKGTPVQLQRVFDEEMPVLTDLFVGPVTRVPVIAMGVPVYRDGRVVYSLNVGIAPQRVEDVLKRQKLPDGWTVAVLDSAGTIVARNRDMERFLGQKAVPALVDRMKVDAEATFDSVTKEGYPVVSSYSRSGGYGWTVAVGAPKALLDQSLNRTILVVVLVALVTFGIGLLLARKLARRVTSSVRELNQAALALSGDQVVILPYTKLIEADAVGDAIVKASQILSHVRHLAYHDALTGLCNRPLFDELLQRQIAAAQRTQGTFAVLAIDLDGFKAVNDVHGHGVGDQVLKITAQRIVATIRASDAAARLGGDEFAVLLGDIDAASAIAMAERLVDCLAEPYPDVQPAVSASVGLAMYPESGELVERLIEKADAALYIAKKSGKRKVVFKQA